MRQVRAAALGAAAVVVAVVAAVVAAEGVHWWAYRRLSRPETEDGFEVIVVLGYPTRRDGRLHPVQRWRARIADEGGPIQIRPAAFTASAKSAFSERKP